MDELKPDVASAMNSALCAFAMRWELDGDYIRCRQCTSPQLTTYSDREFLHHPGCKAAGTVETHPWRTYLDLLAPLAAARNTRAASGGDSASLEQRARTTELLRLHAEPIPVAVEDGVWFMVREQDALDAITAALANQQGVEMSSGQIAALARLASGDRESNPDDQTKWIVRQLLTGHAGYELYAHMTDYPEEGTFLLEAYAGDKK